MPTVPTSIGHCAEDLFFFLFKILVQYDKKNKWYMDWEEEKNYHYSLII